MQTDKTNKNPQAPPKLSKACITNHPWGDRSVLPRGKCGNWSQEKELAEGRKPRSCSGRGWVHHTELAAQGEWDCCGLSSKSWALHPALGGGTRVKVPALLLCCSRLHLGRDGHKLGRCSLVSKSKIIQKRNSNSWLSIWCGCAFIAQHSLNYSVLNHSLAFKSHTWSHIMTHGQGYGTGRTKNLHNSKFLLPSPPILVKENFPTFQTPLVCLTGYIVTS